MISKVYSLNELTEMIAPLLGKYDAKNAILFGSYARNEATPDSDIDLLVIGGESFEPTDVFSIADELYEKAGKNVDVYEEREINRGSPFHRSIMNEGVRLA